MSPDWSLLNPGPWTGAESPGDRAQEGWRIWPLSLEERLSFPLRDVCLFGSIFYTKRIAMEKILEQPETLELMTCWLPQPLQGGQGTHSSLFS